MSENENCQIIGVFKGNGRSHNHAEGVINDENAGNSFSSASCNAPVVDELGGSSITTNGYDDDVVLLSDLTVVEIELLPSSTTRSHSRTKRIQSILNKIRLFSLRSSAGRTRSQTKKYPQRISRIKRRFSCRFCSIPISNRTHLINHIQSHYATAIGFRCERCGLVFSRKGSLKVHNDNTAIHLF